MHLRIVFPIIKDMDTFFCKNKMFFLLFPLFLFLGCERITVSGEDSALIHQMDLVRTLSGEVYSLSTLQFEYDVSNRIVRLEEILEKDGNRHVRNYSFRYDGDMCILTRQNDDEVPVQDRFIFKNGLCIAASGTEIIYENRKATVFGDTRLTWKDGDCIRSERPAGVCSFSYYPDENPFSSVPDMVFNFGLWTPEPLVYGFCGEGNRHLVKKAEHKDFTIEWTYTYNSQKRISSFIRKEGTDILTAKISY